MTKFKTHQEIDEYYASKGLDIAKLKREEQAVGIALDKSESDAIDFLKKRLGSLRYFFWTIFSFELIPLLGRGSRDKRKAKELGWKDTFQYPKEFA